MKRLLLVLGLSIAWNCPGAIAAPANSTGTSDMSLPKNPAAAKVFKKGIEAYDQKRYDEAVTFFRSVLQRQPDHTPSKIYLARSLYQQKNLIDALKAFRDVDFKDIEPNAAYDYGQAAFRSGEYQAAIKAFSIVPNGHPLYDLAGYYGGISAYKLGEFQQSMDLFDQAVVLPSKLVRSQKLYRAEAEKKLFQKQKAEVQGSGISNGKGRGPIQTNFVYQPARDISLTHTSKSQSSKAKEAKAIDANMQRTTLALRYGTEKPAAGVRSQWLSLIDIQASSVKDNEQELLILPTPRESLENAALVRFKPESLVQAELAAGYETAIGSISTIGFVAGVYSFASDGSFADKLMYSPYLSLFLAQKGDSLETMLSVETHPRFDSDKLLITQTVQDGLLLFHLSKNVFLSLKGQLNEYSYNTTKLSGPDWNGRGQIEIGYEKNKSFTLALGTFYEIAQGWRLYDVSQELPLVKFNLSQTGGYVRGEVNLTSWWTFGVRAKVAQNSYANVLPVEGDNFPIGGLSYLDAGFASSISQYAFYTSLIKSF